MGTQGDGSGDGAAGGPDSKKDDIYENRSGHKKIVRVVTVMAYMVSVSFVAIVLSAYYVFLWQPPNPRLMHRSHLRADPQVEYLVHGPPIESADDVPQDGIDAPDRVIVLGEKISLGSERDKSGRSKSLKVSGVEPRSKEEKLDDDRPTSTRAWNPIVRALLATTENPSVETLTGSTGVYESLDATMKSSLKTESSSSEIDGSRSSGSASDSMTMTESGDELYGSVNYSDFITERGDKLYEESVNYSTTIYLDDSSEENGADFGRGFGESMRRANESSGNFTPEVQPISIGIAETSGKSRPVEAQPETLGTTANSGRDFGESMRMRADESLENSANFRPEVQPIPIGVEARRVSTVRPSGKSRPAQAQPEMLGTTANFGPVFGESMRMSSTNLTPEVQPIPIRVEERSVLTVGTSAKSRPAQAQPETLGTANFGPVFGESMRMSSTNFTPEVQPIPIGLEEKSVSTVRPSGKSRPAQAQPEMLGTTANFSPVFGELMKMSSTNFTPEVQPIPIGVEDRSVLTIGTSGKPRPAQAQPETLGTTAASDQQRGLDWKPLGFTVQPTKLGSPITRVEAKSPINDTDPVGKFSSALEVNEDVSIEMIAGPARDAELASEQSASALPAVVQPESDYVDK